MESNTDSVKLKVDNIKYTQNSISNKFSNGLLLKDANQNLTKILRVVIFENNIYSLNNRSLYVLKKNNRKNIQCKIIPYEECVKEFEKKFTTKTNGETIIVRGEENDSDSDSESDEGNLISDSDSDSDEGNLISDSDSESDEGNLISDSDSESDEGNLIRQFSNIQINNNIDLKHCKFC